MITVAAMRKHSRVKYISCFQIRFDSLVCDALFIVVHSGKEAPLTCYVQFYIMPLCVLLANAADNLCSLSALDGTSVVSEEQRTAKIKHTQLTFAK